MKEAVAERDAKIAGLEAALDHQGQALRRARRLYAELGGVDAAKPRAGEDAEDDSSEGAEQGHVRGRRERAEQRRSAASGADRIAGSAREPKFFGRAELREIAGLVKDVLHDEPASGSNGSTGEPADDEGSDNDEDGP